MTDPAGPAPGPRPRIGRSMAIALAVVAAWTAFLIFYGPSGGAGRLAPPRLAAPPAPMPPVDVPWTLRDLDGKPADFASFRGRPVLLNLWATWCPPCVAEMPSIAALAADPRMKGVAIVCVSLDGSPEAPRRFAQGKGWAMTMLHANDVPPPFQTEGIPATFVLDRDGRVVASEMGAARWDDSSVIEFFAKLAGREG